MYRLFQARWVRTPWVLWVLFPCVHTLTGCERDEIAGRLRDEIPLMVNNVVVRADGGGRKLQMANHDDFGREGTSRGCIRGRTSGGARKLRQITTRGDTIGGLVRLSFHDAGTYDVAGTGGRPDGCILMDAAENGGIKEDSLIVERIYNESRNVISRADFWALAANVALEEALPNGVTRNIPFRWGRLDVSSCNADFGKLPDSEGNLDSVKAWAMNQLGMTEEETVALMGAHTLGRAVPANSGYRGAWVQADAVLDNAYFQDLVDRPWGRETNDFRDIGINRTTTQWNDINRMMLTTDMVLAYDLGDEPNTGGLFRCGGPVACPPSSTRAHVDKFRASNADWYAAFFPAWQKLQELGYADGDLKEVETCNTTAATSPASSGSAAGGRSSRDWRVGALAWLASATLGVIVLCYNFYYKH